MLERVRHRFVRSRPGSVLVLVVALIVLIAIIGAAFLFMAQTDRVTSIQHENNTEIDLLLDGVVAMVRGEIVSDQFALGKFHPAARYNTGDPGTYNNYTGIGDQTATANPGTIWLASRLPELAGETSTTALNGVPGGGNWPLWRTVSAPLTGGVFSSPIPPVGPAFLLNQSANSYTQRTSLAGRPLYPGSLKWNGQTLPAWVDNPASPGSWVLAADADGDGIADSGLAKLPMGPIDNVTYYAAVRVIDNAAAVNANIAWQHNPYISAPPTPPYLPGDFFPSNIDLLDLLVGADANVSTGGSGINQLLNLRFGLPLNTTPPLGSAVLSAVPPDCYPWDDYINEWTPLGVQRSPVGGSVGGDIDHYSFFEAQWNGLGRRLKNPGYWAAPPYPSGRTQFAPFPIGESLTLARNFVIRAPGSSSELEQVLPNSLSSPLVPAAPYDPSDIVNWFFNPASGRGNFGFLQSYLNSGANTLPLRSVLTSDNAVSNFCPSKFRDVGTVDLTAGGAWAFPASAGTPLFGDSVAVRFIDPLTKNIVTHRYACINPNSAATSPVQVPYFNPLSDDSVSQAWVLDNDTWIYQPWNTNSVKAAVNTATFGQLYLAYWSVMAEQQRANGEWAPPFPSTGPDTATPVQVAGTSPRMFRNPIRVTPSIPSPTTWQLSPIQVMQLRAALAAVNTIDFRDGDDDVTARNVHLVDNSPITQPNLRMHDVIATVYGLERQPYITKVYATNQVQNPGTNQQDGYVAIELFNPDPVRALGLAGYALAWISRPASASPSATPPNFNPTLIPFDTGADWFANTPPLIPPGQSIVIASSSSPPPGLSIDPAVSVYVVQNLVQPRPPAPAPATAWKALGNELMLLRPRAGNGTPTSTLNTPAPATGGPTPLIPVANQTDPQNRPYPFYNEGASTLPPKPTFTPNPADMVPVDSYDFTGLNTLDTTIVPAPAPVSWYYVRPNKITAPDWKAWHWVYPGHYVISSAITPRLVDGTWTGSGIDGALIAATGSGSSIPFGTRQGTAKSDYKDVPIQLNSLDFAGPNTARLSSSGSTKSAFPYGGFARNGDMLEIPFIGSYRLEIPDPAAGNPTGTVVVLEMNPVTMDAAFALGLAQGPNLNEPPESQFPVASVRADRMADPIFSGALPVENIGRFCPMDPYDFTPPNAALNDFAPAAGGIPPQWLYHFATRLFDYLMVQSPQQDYTPDADPSVSDLMFQSVPPPYPPFPPAYNIHMKYESPSVGGVGSDPPAPIAVPNVALGTANGEPANPGGATEETVPSQGLVNINSAPWRVLAAVPWVPADYPKYDGVASPMRVQANINIGLSIARFRDIDDGSGAIPPHGHGPFRSIFELNNVPVYQFLKVAGTSLPSPTLFRNLLNDHPPPYTCGQGNVTPAYAADTVLNDFKTKFTVLSRASNLITTRSDSFTVYILLQGWLNAETTNATLAVQRRAAFLIDRSGVTPINSNPTITRVPTN